MKCGEKNSVKAERRKGNRGKRIMTKSRLKRQKMREGRRKVQRWKEGVGVSKLFLKLLLLFFFRVANIFNRFEEAETCEEIFPSPQCGIPGFPAAIRTVRKRQESVSSSHVWCWFLMPVEDLFQYLVCLLVENLDGFCIYLV